MLDLNSKSFTPDVKFLNLTINTPYNIGSVLWRLFDTLEVVQYMGGGEGEGGGEGGGDNIDTVMAESDKMFGNFVLTD